jgi:hypothetical protein
VNTTHDAKNHFSIEIRRESYNHGVPDLCDHPRFSAPGLLLLPRSSSLRAMPHLPPAHHETSKRDSLNETKVKEKQNKTILDSNSNLTMSMTHHNQTKKRTTHPPCGAHTFNTAWTVLHTSRECIHVLRKWPQNILRSLLTLGTRLWLITRRTSAPTAQ